MRFISETFFRQSVRGFASHHCKYGVLWCTIPKLLNDKKNHHKFLGDRLELWPSKHTLFMVKHSKDKNGSVKLIEFRSLWELNSHRCL